MPNLNSLTPLNEQEVSGLSDRELITRLENLTSSVAGTSPDGEMREGSKEALPEIGIIIKRLAEKGRHIKYVVLRGEFLIDAGGRAPILGGNARQFYVRVLEGSATIFER